MRVFVSWPIGWEPFFKGRHDTNPQISWHLLDGMRKRFENVQWIDYDKKPDFEIKTADWLISHNSYPARERGEAAEPIKSFLEAGAHWNGHTNDPILPYTAGHGMYDLHGHISGFDGKRMNFCDPNNHHWQRLLEIKKADFTLCHVSDLQLKRWNEKHPLTEEWRKQVGDANFIPIVSPIAKEAFPREVFDSSKKRFLIPNPCVRKQPHKILDLIGADNCMAFGDTSWFIPEQYNRIVQNCSFIAHPSLQESMPYFMQEAMCKGLLPIGGEDWFDGYGHEQLIFRQSADGSTMPANREKLLWLLSDSPLVEQLYHEVLDRHFARKDNEWDYFCDVIEREIRRLS